jgi:hypothetical protein
MFNFHFPFAGHLLEERRGRFEVNYLPQIQPRRLSFDRLNQAQSIT